MKPSDGASNLLAGSKQRGYAARMRTLHLRNVPDDVMERLERMARAASTSVTAVAIRELDAATRRVDNAALLATLPDLDIRPRPLSSSWIPTDGGLFAAATSIPRRNSCRSTTSSPVPAPG